MAQVIKIKRGTELARVGLPVALGEIIYTTDDYGVYFGTGASDGGTEIGYLSLANGGTVGGDVAISGNLTVTGDVTQTSTQTVNIGDSILTLAADNTDNPANDAGITVYRGTVDDAASILWNETDDHWELNIPTDTSGNVTTGRIYTTLDAGAMGYTGGTGITVSAGGEIANSDLGSSQSIFKSVTGDTGTITAASNTDTFKIAGAGGNTTSVAGNTLTVTGTVYTAGDFLHDSLDYTGSTKYHIADAGTNSGKVLTASGTAGVFTWESAGAATNDAEIHLDGDSIVTVTSSLDGLNGFFTTNQNTNETFTVAHKTTDGFKHVTATTSAANDDKVLTVLDGTTGSFGWVSLPTHHVPMTLATVAGNYLSLQGTDNQEIVAGVVPISLGGTGATTLGGAQTALGIDTVDNSPSVTIVAGTASGSYLVPGGTKGHAITVNKLQIQADTGMASSDSSLAISGNNVTVNIVDGGTF